MKKTNGIKWGFLLSPHSLFLACSAARNSSVDVQHRRRRFFFRHSLTATAAANHSICMRRFWPILAEEYAA